jgi:protoporphyrinogen oxidase
VREASLGSRAFYLSQELPDAKITLYEGSPRLGGWLQSRRIDVGNGEVVFEQGPRTLRPATPSGYLIRFSTNGDSFMSQSLTDHTY